MEKTNYFQALGHFFFISFSVFSTHFLVTINSLINVKNYPNSSDSRLLNHESPPKTSFALG